MTHLLDLMDLKKCRLFVCLFVCFVEWRTGGDETVKIYTSAPESTVTQIKLEPPSERSSPGPGKILRNKAIASTLPVSSLPVKTEPAANGFASAGTPEPEISEPVGRGGKRKLRAGVAAASVGKEREKRSKNPPPPPPPPTPQASAGATAASATATNTSAGNAAAATTATTATATTTTTTTTSSTGSSSEDASGSDNDRSKKTANSFKETKQVTTRPTHLIGFTGFISMIAMD